MSKIALTPNASGTGTLTIAAPNTNTDRTLTLPDASDTLMGQSTPVTQSQLATALNASGSAPLYAARAWVNFNGTGTVAIRGSGNVSSITDNGAGDYTVNFATAMPDANYALSGSSSGATTTLLCVVVADSATARTATAVRIVTTFQNASAPFDSANTNVTIFR